MAVSAVERSPETIGPCSIVWGIDVISSGIVSKLVMKFLASLRRIDFGNHARFAARRARLIGEKDWTRKFKKYRSVDTLTKCGPTAG
jgi:hypothetical protein